MSNNLADVWFEVENLLNQNISVVPVRDKDSIYNGKLYEAKTPYKEWKKYQYEIIDRAVLFQEMTDKDTTAIAMICGAISGNLEVIDFDVKYKPGIDAVVISAMRELYPDIFAKLRTHRTRSGGTHLIYRIADHEVPASTHLAEREATPEEIAANPKGKKTRCFIETRGTGGMATAPPSLGYAIINNIPVQTITWEERCSIIELCKAYNEYIVEEKPYKPPKSEVDYYDENPFAHYNRTVDPVELFKEYGWTYVRKHGDYIWFTRPGGRRGEVHAGYNTNTCTYRVWGTKADLDSERSYTPSTILAHYRFNGDKALAYAHLVQQGYGRIKPSMELKMARTRAINKMPMPTNASPAAVEQYTQIAEQLLTAHPHDIYWEITNENGEDKAVISRLGFKDVATKLGFRLHGQDIVQIDQQFIYRRELRYFFDCMRGYIKEEDAEQYELIYNAAQAFLEKHGKFESTQLDFIDETLILSDTRTTCYKFYLNGYVKINVHGFELINYETVTDKLIWHEKIQQRDFVLVTATDSSTHNERSDGHEQLDARGLYTSFLELACDLDNNRQHIMKTIGWLAHDYKDTTTGYIVTLTEKCADPKDGGGSGKNLFCQLLEHTTTLTTVDAAQKRFESANLLQSWNNEKLFILSDPKKDFDFGMLKEPSTGSATVKKLFKNEQNYKCSELPKFIVPTNFSYEVTDGGLRRRIIAIEFTNFFTLCGGVDRHFGKYFPDDWSTEDWADYDTFICQCIHMWIEGGLKLNPIGLEGTGWEKQFAQTYGQYTFEFITAHWHEWRGNTVSNLVFKQQYEEFFNDLGLTAHNKYRPTMHRINKALEDWCKHYDVEYNKDAMIRNGLSVEKGRSFTLPDAPF